MRRHLFLFYVVLQSLLHEKISGKRLSDCECGIKEESLVGTRIYGGTEANPLEFPWQVLLSIHLESGSFRCGGTLISDRHVLTAAHCITPKPFTGNFSVTLGEHSVSQEEGYEVFVEVSNYLVHPKWDAVDLHYDFALLRLAEPLDLSLYDYIRPICLPTREFINYPDNSSAWALGWGRGTKDLKFQFSSKCDDSLENEGCYLYGDETLSEGSDKLQKLELSIVKHSECMALYKKFSTQFRPDRPVTIFGHNLCASRPDKLGDVCQGDSGGSLARARLDTGKYELIGVVSYGFGCGSEYEGRAMPAIFGRISSIVPWLLRETRDGGFCSD